MRYLIDNKLVSLLIFVAILVLLIVCLNALIIKFSGNPTSVPDISSDEITIGEAGEELNFLVLGDSTSVSQGSVYEEGFVVNISKYLAENYTVTYKNVGVSGAVVNDLLSEQLEAAGDFVPDLVLIAAGANDVTHLTSLGSIENDLHKIIEELRSKNPQVKIVLTGAAAMDTVTRFPQPTRWIAGVRTNQINEVFKKVVSNKNVSFAAIAEKTRKTFNQHPEYFAQDNFHPNADGYAVWTSVLIDEIDKTLRN